MGLMVVRTEKRGTTIPHLSRFGRPIYMNIFRPHNGDVSAFVQDIDRRRPLLNRFPSSSSSPLRRLAGKGQPKNQTGTAMLTSAACSVENHISISCSIWLFFLGIILSFLTALTIVVLYQNFVDARDATINGCVMLRQDLKNNFRAVPAASRASHPIIVLGLSSAISRHLCTAHKPRERTDIPHQIVRQTSPVYLFLVATISMSFGGLN